MSLYSLPLCIHGNRCPLGQLPTNEQCLGIVIIDQDHCKAHTSISGFCVYPSEAGFNLDCIPGNSMVRILKQGLHSFDPWWWSWQRLAVMHCLVIFHVSDSFYFDSLWLLLYGMQNHMDTSQLNTWTSEFSSCWQHVLWFLFWFVSYFVLIKPYQYCVYSGLFRLCFAEMLNNILHVFP